jgi:ABC-type Fe3+-hydroxamate transport system substrate-binding protein
MINIIKQAFIAILCYILIISCNNKSYQKEQHNHNKIRIVSLAQSLTKELMDLGLDSSIVGATSYCDVSLKNPDLIIGTSTEVNVEKILLLKPDLIVASVLTSQATITTLKNNGINVYTCPKMDSYEAICKHFVTLGKLVGKEELANSIVISSKKKIDSLRNIIPTKAQKQTIFFQIGANPLFTVIPNTYMNDFITLAGCENIASDFTRGTITRESVLQRNPDIIFIVTMGIAGDQEKETWESYKELKAAMNKKIFVIDSEMACTPTVQTFTKSVELIFKSIYF